MSVSMASIGAFFYLFSDPETMDHDLRAKLEWLPLLSLIVYMIGYSIGFACVPFLLLGEMLPGIVNNLLIPNSHLYLLFQIKLATVVLNWTPSFRRISENFLY
jgi:hypothetical protein